MKNVLYAKLARGQLFGGFHLFICVAFCFVNFTQTILILEGELDLRNFQSHIGLQTNF